MTFDHQTPHINCRHCVGQWQCLVGRQEEPVRQRWASCVSERTFRKGEELLRQGHPAHAFGIVKVGTLLLLRSGEDGVERPVGLSGSGQLLGASALYDEAASLSCRAITPGRICALQLATLERHGSLDALFFLELIKCFAQNHAQLADWTRIVHIKGVAGQLASTLLQLAALQKSSRVQLPSHTVLAALLCTSRETIARTLAQLAQQGCVVRHERRLCEIVRAPLLALAANGSGPGAARFPQ